eukprot:165288_1
MMLLSRFQIALVIGMIFSGSSSILLNKLVVKLFADKDDWLEGRDGVVGVHTNEAGEVTHRTKAHRFDHTFMFTIFMFLGEIMNLVMYYWLIHINRPDLAGKPESRKIGVPRAKWWNFSWPALFDTVSTTIQIYGYSMVTPSMYQMFKGAIVPVMAVYSWIFLKKRPTSFQYVGMVLVVAALAVVGGGDQLKPTNDATARNPNMGLALILFATMLSGGFYVCENKILDTYPNEAGMKVVGYEGCIGLVMVLVICIPAYWTPVPEFMNDIEPKQLENILDMGSQIASAPIILLYAFLFSLASAVYNYTGINLTKTINASARVIFAMLRIVVVWMVSVAVGWETFNPAHYAYWMKLVGFVMLVLGTMIYHAAIHLPGFEYPTVAEGKEPAVPPVVKRSVSFSREM